MHNSGISLSKCFTDFRMLRLCCLQFYSGQQVESSTSPDESIHVLIRYTTNHELLKLLKSDGPSQCNNLQVLLTSRTCLNFGNKKVETRVAVDNLYIQRDLQYMQTIIKCTLLEPLFQNTSQIFACLQCCLLHWWAGWKQHLERWKHSGVRCTYITTS